MKLVHVVCVLAMLTAACAPAAEPGGAPNTAGLVGTPSVAAPPTSIPPPPPTAKTPTPTQAVKAMPEPTVDNQSRVQPTAPPQATVINCKQKAGVPLDAKKGEAAFVSGMNRFGFDYYRAVTDGEGKSANLIYSPYSISTAFSMVYAGACSNTETQIAKVLGFLPQASHHAASETLQRRLDDLAFRPVPNQRTGNLPFQLRDANAVWGQTGYPFADAYQRVLAEHYGSRVRPVDFISDFEGGRNLVNDWMWKETE